MGHHRKTLWNPRTLVPLAAWRVIVAFTFGYLERGPQGDADRRGAGSHPQRRRGSVLAGGRRFGPDTRPQGLPAHARFVVGVLEGDPPPHSQRRSRGVLAERRAKGKRTVLRCSTTSEVHRTCPVLDELKAAPVSMTLARSRHVSPLSTSASALARWCDARRSC